MCLLHLEEACDMENKIFYFKVSDVADKVKVLIHLKTHYFV